MRWATRCLAALAILTAGCADGMAPGAGGPATLTIHLKDAQGDVQAAVVTISEVYLQGTGGRVVVLNTPYTVDLAMLTTTSTVMLSDVPLEAGTYSQLRFVVTGAYLAVDDGNGGSRIYASSPDYAELPAGATVDGALQLPSYSTSGLKVVLPGGGLHVPASANVSLLVDFDVAQSFGQAAGQSGQWVMHPVITATDITQIAMPTGIAFTDAGATTQYGNLSGGVAYDDACPDGQAVMGYHGFLTSAPYNGKIQALCGTLAIGPGPAVTVTPGATLDLRGNVGATEWTRTCGTDQVVVGFSGRSGALVDQLTFECAPLDISLQGNTYAIAVGQKSLLAPVGGTTGSAFDLTECPAGAIATVSHIRAGDNIDAFGLGCSTVSLVF
jgi:hypothetical protein